MLSNISIQQFLDSKDIIIDPWEESMMGSNSITMRLGSKLVIPTPGATIDIKNNTLPDYSEIILDDQNPFILTPGMFVLGQVYEKIGLSEKIGMLIDGRSTIARFGVMVIQTAMILDSGQKPKTTTLEIKNNSQNPVLLYPKMKFCKAVFFKLDPPATIRYDTDGKYQANDPLKPILAHESTSDSSV